MDSLFRDYIREAFRLTLRIDRNRSLRLQSEKLIFAMRFAGESGADSSAKSVSLGEELT
jgi:hypothetical protein